MCQTPAIMQDRPRLPPPCLTAPARAANTPQRRLHTCLAPRTATSRLYPAAAAPIFCSLWADLAQKRMRSGTKSREGRCLQHGRGRPEQVTKAAITATAAGGHNGLRISHPQPLLASPLSSLPHHRSRIRRAPSQCTQTYNYVAPTA